MNAGLHRLLDGRIHAGRVRACRTRCSIRAGSESVWFAQIRLLRIQGVTHSSFVRNRHSCTEVEEEQEGYGDHAERHLNREESHAVGLGLLWLCGKLTPLCMLLIVDLAGGS